MIGICCLYTVTFEPWLDGSIQLLACLPGAQGVPGSINVSIKVLLRRLASANTVARVIIGEYITVDACA